jgi:ADP-heptose:LPS heptosyltransferase
VPTTQSKGIAKQVWRPWLTTRCERLLLRMAPTVCSAATNPLPSTPRRLLVVKVFGMGDSVLIRSIVEKLRARHPAIQIGVLVSSTTRELMTTEACVRIHQYVPRELSIRSALQMLREIRRCSYDAILNCEQRSLAGSAFLALAGARYHLGFMSTSGTAKDRFLTHAVRFRENESVWQSFIRLARLIDSGLPQMFLPTFPRLNEEVEEWASRWWSKNVGTGSAPTIALHVGSQDREFSRWPVQRFVEFAERAHMLNADISVMLTGTAPESDLIHTFIRTYSGRAIDASETGSVLRTAALLKRSSLLVSNDTGIMHLGAALDIPTVGLFGPNSPRYWAPLGARATYVYDTKVPCSPCLNLYIDRWPLECGHSEKGRCMLDITSDSVMSAAKRVIEGEWLN